MAQFVKRGLPVLALLHCVVRATAASAAVADSVAVDTAKVLQGITVYGSHGRAHFMKSSLPSVELGRDYMAERMGGSLMETLEAVPGVKAMSVGVGQSKPAIRGLGFNRMVVAVDGVKHEGQQWGDDHGLEVDQFAVERAEVVKGPAALLYGSDAIGGVVALKTAYIPQKKFEGSVSLYGRSVNDYAGTAARFSGRRGRAYWKANLTLADYADYRVPTSTVQYFSYDIPLKGRRLRNTAGSEAAWSVQTGYSHGSISSDIKVSSYYTKGGFFANARGLEARLSEIDYDRSVRDIDLPGQDARHTIVQSTTKWAGGGFSLEAVLAYQRNVRNEYAEPVAHGYMPVPEGSLERRFGKSTYTASVSSVADIAAGHTLSVGVSAEVQRNKIGGWGFVIPAFSTLSAGAYAMDKWTVNSSLALNVGLRVDLNSTRISGYRDWYKTPVGGDSAYIERSVDLSRLFHSVTGGAGLVWAKGGWKLKANVGKSFRVPIPKELGADGVNYHIFRYERGETGLSPEESYQADAGIGWSGGGLRLQADPYINYFPNYIYMDPTAEYVDGLQLYRYVQSRVLRYGVEAEASWYATQNLLLSASYEWLRARQLSGRKKGYGLPFSPPTSAVLSARYIVCPNYADECWAEVRAAFTGSQYEIVPPEKNTDGSFVLSLSVSKRMDFGFGMMRIGLNVENLLDTTYYDHTSYYRLINVPEPGRNVSLALDIRF